MTKNSPLGARQRSFFDLLRDRSGKSVTDEEILEATGWKRSTWKVYSGNGVLDPFLAPVSAGTYKVVCPPDIDEWEFHRRLSQSPQRRHIGAPCKQALARELVKKSRDNMILALELYNRPSLENRLDAFSMLFCTAWEQLLKAELIEQDGETAIFRPQKPGRRRESISLSDAVAKCFDQNDLVRKNLETIEELRHGATHLLMAPLQAPLSRLFQAGVINFSTRFKEVAAEPLLPRSAVGLLSLVGDDSLPDATDLKKLYGEITAADIAELAAELGTEIRSVNDPRFAVTVEYRLALTKKEKDGDIMLATAADGANTGLVLVKPVSVDKTHPFRAAEVLTEVTMRTSLPFNRHDLQAVLHKEGWKNSDNEFHHLQLNPDTSKYSEKAVAYICRCITQRPEYLQNARESLSHHNRSLRSKSKTAS